MDWRYQKLNDIIPYLVNEDHGIIKSITELEKLSGHSDFFYFKAVLGNTGIFGNIESYPTAAGVSLDRDTALAKAIGESIERYSSAIYHYEDLLYDSFENLEDQAIHPNEFNHLSSKQFQAETNPCAPFTVQSKTYWAKALNLIDQQFYYVPASMVYCPYEPNYRIGEHQYFETMSTGLSAHITDEKAIINGILEVIERDAFMSFWLLQKEIPQIEKSSVNERCQKAISKFHSIGYEVDLRVNTGDHGIPTIISQLFGSNGELVPHVIAAATCLNPNESIEKSLAELSLMERFIQKRKDQNSFSQPVNHLHDHVLFWLNPNNKLPAFLRKKSSHLNIQKIGNFEKSSDSQSLLNIVQKIEATGHKILAVDVTLPEIKSLGMHVYRSLIPGYLPLNKRSSCRPIGSPRLLAQLKSLNLSHSDLNPLPHPFA